ncbi:MAG: DnaJ domain-containing protein [Firmicutes bacterium]|nr:DnaJ domain-containing protein [Bacillota bacterium]
MIDNPYKVLGLEEGASDDEIKKAYRQMAKINHPDLHPNDPDAVARMNEINEAYDMLTNPEKYAVRKAQQEAQQQNSDAEVVRDYGAAVQQGIPRPTVQPGDGFEVEKAVEQINANQGLTAIHLLTHVPSADRDARWFYLSGLAHYVKGDYVQAADQMEKACQMDPQNQSYQNHLWQFRQIGQNHGKKAAGFPISPLIPLALIVGYFLGKLIFGN